MQRPLSDDLWQDGEESYISDVHAHRCAKYQINAVMLHRVHWWKSGIKMINISNRSLCNYTSPWHSVSASQKNNSCGTLVRHLPCLIEGLINETSCRPFNGDEFPWRRSEAPVFSLWNYNETQMIFFFFEWKRRAVSSLTQSCRLLDFRRIRVNIETAWRRTRWCYECGGCCVPWRGFHMCLTGRRKIPPQISRGKADTKAISSS